MKKIAVNVIVAVLIVCMAVCLSISIRQSIDWQAKYRAEHEKYNDVERIIRHYETQESKRVFDTSIIEHGYRDKALHGKVRMVSAVIVSIDGILYTLEDETEELWIVDNVALDGTDNVLLWIVDNDTDNDVTDDVVIKVFVEAHNLSLIHI